VFSLLRGWLAAECGQRVHGLGPSGAFFRFRVSLLLWVVAGSVVLLVHGGASESRHDGQAPMPTRRPSRHRTEGTFGEVVEARKVFGNPDFFLRIVVRDVEECEQFQMQRLTALPASFRVDSPQTMKLLRG